MAASRDANYKFVRHIGRGGMAVVELWRQKLFDEELVVAKRVFVGEMTSEEEKDARREAQVLKRVQHPYIVRYLGSWVSRQSHDLIIVQDYCAGGDLAQLIRKHRESQQHFEVDQIIKWLSELAHALQYCHRRLRVLHRDLKPSNVFLTEDLEVRLGDFGVAKALGSTRSLCNTFIGTQVYMSPEVLRMQQYGLKSDVWGLGMILYEACVLDRLFRHANPVALVHAIVSPDKPPPFPAKAGYPQVLQDICFEMLEKDDEKRPTLSELMANRPLLRQPLEELERKMNWTDTLIPPPEYSAKSSVSRLWEEPVIEGNEEEELDELDVGEDGEKELGKSESQPIQVQSSSAPIAPPVSDKSPSPKSPQRSREDLSRLSIKELKEVVKTAGGDPSSYLEKSELIEAAWRLEAKDSEAEPPPPTASPSPAPANSPIPPSHPPPWHEVSQSPVAAAASSSPEPSSPQKGSERATPLDPGSAKQEKPGLTGFAEAAAQRLTVASSQRESRVNVGMKGKAVKEEVAEEVATAEGERGWGAPPPPAPPAEPPPWWTPAQKPPEEASDGPEDEAAATEAVVQAAEVRDLVELTLRRKELEAVLAKAPMQQEAAELDLEFDEGWQEDLSRQSSHNLDSRQSSHTMQSQTSMAEGMPVQSPHASSSALLLDALPPAPAPPGLPPSPSRRQQAQQEQLSTEQLYGQVSPDKQPHTAAEQPQMSTVNENDVFSPSTPLASPSKAPAQATPADPYRKTPTSKASKAPMSRGKSFFSAMAAEAKATMMLGARLRTVRLLEKQAPDPAELSQALRRNRDMEMESEDAGQALIAHAHRLQMKAEDTVKADEKGVRIAKKGKSRVDVLEPAAEVLETVAPETGGCESGLLERAQSRLQHAQGESQKVGLRCRCGPVVRLLTADEGMSLADVRALVAKRFQRPEEGLVLTWIDGQSSMALAEEEQWQHALRVRRSGPIELEVPKPGRPASGSGVAAARRKRNKVSLAGLAASSSGRFGGGEDLSSAAAAAKLQQQRFGRLPM